MNNPRTPILVVLSRFPYPLEKGDKLRAYQHLSYLASAGYDTHLVALTTQAVSPEHYEKVRSLCSSVTVVRQKWYEITFNILIACFTGLPFQVGYFKSNKAWRVVRKLADELSPTVAFFQLIRAAQYRKAIPAVIPSLIDYQDAFSVGLDQRAQGANLFLRWIYSREARAVRRYEGKVYSWFETHAIISIADMNALKATGPMDVLPNGVDTSFFAPTRVAKQYHVAFVGNMNYQPNIDAAEFLVGEIMPLVWKLVPNARVLIAGASPHRRVRALGSDSVEVIGWVDDIRECYASSRVFVAPMRTGTGMQNKLLEAMAMSVPTVTTPMSAEPLGVGAGTCISIGSSRAQLADHIIAHLQDEDAAREFGMRGRDYILNTFSHAKIAERLTGLLERTRHF